MDADPNATLADILGVEIKENILIVFHGFMLFNFQRELRKRGFVGKKLKFVKNGVLYEYVREDSEKDVNMNENNADLYREAEGKILDLGSGGILETTE